MAIGRVGLNGLIVQTSVKLNFHHSEHKTICIVSTSVEPNGAIESDIAIRPNHMEEEGCVSVQISNKNCA